MANPGCTRSRSPAGRFPAFGGVGAFLQLNRLAGVVLAMAAGVAVAGDHDTPAEFAVTNTVLRPAEKTPPLGANYSGQCGAVDWAANNFVMNPGNEPVYSRDLSRVQNSGPGWFEALLSGKLYGGAIFRIYRLVDKDGNALPGNIDPQKADHAVFVGKGRITPEEAGDSPDANKIIQIKSPRIMVTEDTPRLERGDYIVVERRLDNPEALRINQQGRPPDGSADPLKWHWKQGESSKLSFSLVRHPAPLPAEMAELGETCLAVKADGGPQVMSQTVFIGTQNAFESIWYGQLEPDKQYRLEVWLRQEGLQDDGAVTFSYGIGYPDIKQTFKVAGEWKKFGCAFTGPPRPTKETHFGHQFAFTGPGTLWMDNCRIYRCDKPEDADKLYVPNATVLEELLRSQPQTGRKGTHRSWFLARHATMSSIMSWHANSMMESFRGARVAKTLDMTLPMGLSFDLHTGADPQSRMRPWLVLQHVLHSEEDWLNLIEYLAAPYDPKIDTPQTRPWAHRRYQQRGVSAPWADEFETITIELGNETWHNGAQPDWIGFGSAVHQGGREYGLFSSYLIKNMKKSPYWRSRNLDKKILFALGGNYWTEIKGDRVTGYGEEAMQACPEAALLGHANYTGLKWEIGEYYARNYNDDGVQACLISFLSRLDSMEANMGRARRMLAGSHHEYDIAAYEGGPGGFNLPSVETNKSQETEINEKYGKSLASAVAAFDAWMRSYMYGWTEQCYLAYAQGQRWNSHTCLWEGFRPSPAWQALAMRNRHARGDLMAVEEKSVPVLQKKDKTYPLAGAYAMRDGNRWSVFVVSRKLDGKHSGADFGEGYTPVTLRLPFARAGRITLHRLTGDPRLTNRDKMNIVEQSRNVPAAALEGGTFLINEKTGGDTGGMPAGSIFLYVFEDAN